jgi:hypothetical protein
MSATHQQLCFLFGGTLELSADSATLDGPPAWRRVDDRRAQRAVALAMFEYGDFPTALNADTR